MSSPQEDNDEDHKELRHPIPLGPGSPDYEKTSYVLWWIRHILLTLAACFFLYFGIQVMIAAYSLNDPFSFVMSFFSASFIILISIALIIGFVWRMILCWRNFLHQRKFSMKS
ncbi:MAG: hypothetical protein AB7S75_02005 [Desulfococcaceae bacterium]